MLRSPGGSRRSRPPRTPAHRRRAAPAGTARNAWLAVPPPPACTRPLHLRDLRQAGVGRRQTAAVTSTRVSGMRPRLRTRLFSTSALEMITCSPVTPRSRVLLMPMCSTVPSMSSMRRLSPMTKGLSSAMDMEPNRSPRMVCTASAMAMPPTPRPATSGRDVARRGSSSASSMNTAQITSWPRNISTPIDARRARVLAAGAAIVAFDAQSAAPRWPTSPAARRCPRR